MKVMVCDACKKEGVLVETRRYVHVNHLPEIRMDLCEKHSKLVRKNYPKVDSKYVQYAMDLHGVKMTETEAKNYLKRGF